MSKKKKQEKKKKIIWIPDTIFGLAVVIVSLVFGFCIFINNLKYLVEPFYNILIVIGLCFCVWEITHLEKWSKYVDAVIIILAFMIRFIFVLKINTSLSSDFEIVFNAAKGLVNGDMSAFADGTYLNHIGYYIPVALYEALFIKLFGTAAVMSLKIANIFFMTGSVALVMAIADKMFGKKAGMTCGFLYAIYPAPIMLTSVLTSQHQEVFFFLLAVYFLLAFKSKIKYLSYVLAGISIALSQFFRPEGIIFFVVVVACIVWKLIAYIYEFRKSREDKKRDVLVKEIKNLVIASALIFGVYFVLYSGMNLVVKCTGLNDEGLVNYIPETKFLMGMDADTYGYYTDEYGYIGEIKDKLERKQAFTNALKENFDRYPGFLSFEITKFNQFWSSYEDPYWSMGSIEGVDGLIDAAYIWVGMERGVAVAIWLLFVVACIITIKKRNYGSIKLGFLHLIILANIAVYMVTELQPRYRYLIMPFVIIGDGSHLLKMSNRQEAIEKHR